LRQSDEFVFFYVKSVCVEMINKLDKRFISSDFYFYFLFMTCLERVNLSVLYIYSLSALHIITLSYRIVLSASAYNLLRRPLRSVKLSEVNEAHNGYHVYMFDT
jgi:hypothetical protein